MIQLLSDFIFLSFVFLLFHFSVTTIYCNIVQTTWKYQPCWFDTIRYLITDQQVVRGKVIFLKRIWRTQVLWWNYCFTLLVMFALSFKAAGGGGGLLYASFFTCVMFKFTSDVTPAHWSEVSMAAAWVFELTTMHASAQRCKPFGHSPTRLWEGNIFIGFYHSV